MFDQLREQRVSTKKAYSVQQSIVESRAASEVWPTKGWVWNGPLSICLRCRQPDHRSLALLETNLVPFRLHILQHLTPTSHMHYSEKSEWGGALVPVHLLCNSCCAVCRSLVGRQTTEELTRYTNQYYTILYYDTSTSRYSRPIVIYLYYYLYIQQYCL